MYVTYSTNTYIVVYVFVCMCVCVNFKKPQHHRENGLLVNTVEYRVVLYLFSKYDVLSSGYQYEGAGDSMSLNFIPVRRAKRCERGRNIHEIATFESFPTHPGNFTIFSQLICYCI